MSLNFTTNNPSSRNLSGIISGRGNYWKVSKSYVLIITRIRKKKGRKIFKGGNYSRDYLRILSCSDEWKRWAKYNLIIESSAATSLFSSLSTLRFLANHLEVLLIGSRVGLFLEFCPFSCQKMLAGCLLYDLGAISTTFN